MLIPLLLGLVLPAQAPAAVGAPAPAAQGLPAAAYEIGPDDVVRVSVYGHADLTQTVTVESDGSFVFPLLGRVQAARLNPNQLEQKLRALLAEGFIRNPQVSVAVLAYRSRNVFVIGEVTHAGAYAITEARSLVEVLARAGPLLPAAGSEVLVLRPRGPEAPGAPAEVIRVDLGQLQTRLEQDNVPLRANDTILVPRAPEVFVSGAVRKPGAYAIRPGTTVRQAISLAGGSRKSSPRIRLVRTVAGHAREAEGSLDDTVSGGDTVVVGHD